MLVLFFFSVAVHILFSTYRFSSKRSVFIYNSIHVQMFVGDFMDLTQFILIMFVALRDILLECVVLSAKSSKVDKTVRVRHCELLF